MQNCMSLDFESLAKTPRWHPRTKTFKTLDWQAWVPVRIRTGISVVATVLNVAVSVVDGDVDHLEVLGLVDGKALDRGVLDVKALDGGVLDRRELAYVCFYKVRGDCAVKSWA